MTETKEVNKTPPMSSQLVDSLMASFMSAALVRIPMHPIDTVKAQLQVVKPSEKVGIFTTMSNIYARDGLLKGFYPGFRTVFFGSAPAGMVFFGSYESSKILLEDVNLPETVKHFSSGFFAETVSCLLWVPIDVIKERLQVQNTLDKSQSNFRYKGDFDALKQLSKQEGIRGVYKGYGATLASFGPFSALYLTTYEEIKTQCKNYYGLERECDLPFACFWGGGAVAGSFAAFLTSPLDMAKLRIQVERGNSAFVYNYKNVFHGVGQIYKEGGVRGLFSGAGARVAFNGPATGISIGLYDSVKKIVRSVRRTYDDE